MENTENIYNNTDFVYFKAMLSAIGVVHHKMYEVRKKPDLVVAVQFTDNPTSPWKPKDEFDECPF